MTERSVIIALKGKIGDFQTKMKQAKASVSDVATEMGKSSKRGDELRRSFGTVADTAGKMGLAAAGGLALVTKTAMDWESAFAGVKKTVDETATTTFGVLEEELRELARTLPATHAEIAGVAEAAGQLGISADDVAEFTEVMVNLGETTNLTAEEAATSIARFRNVMQLAPSDVDRIGSALVELGNNSETTEREILEISQRMAAAGQIAGLSASDVLAFGATLTSVGVEAEAGGTALSKVFTSVRDAAIDGGAKLDIFAATAGVSAEAFVQAFQEDAAGAVEMFIAGLGRMNASGESTTAVFDELELTDQRLMRALLSTASAQDHLTDRLEMGNAAWEENTALAIEAAARYETSEAKMQVAVNNIKDSMIEFGEVALPVLAAAAEKVSEFAQAVGSLPGPVKTAGTSLLGITAVLGGGLWFASKTINGVVSMNEALSTLGVKAPRAAGALKGLGAAAGGLAVLYAAGEAIKALEDASRDSVPGLEAMTSALLNLRDAEVARQFAEDLGDVGAALERIDDPSFAESTMDRMHGMGRQASALASGVEFLAGKVGNDLGQSMTEAEAEIRAVDEALAHIARSGGADLAAQALETLAAAEGWSADEMDNFVANAPAYKEALAGLDNDAQFAADGMGAIGGAAEDAAEEVDGFTEALESFNDAIDQRGDIRSYRDAIRDFNAAAAEAPAKMKRGSAAWDEMEGKLDGIAAAALSVAEDLTGIDRRRFLTNARKSFIEAAIEMGIGRKAAQDLATELGLLDKKDPRIDVWTNVDEVLNDLSLIDRELDWVSRSRDARIYVAVTYDDAGYTPRGGPQKGSADGSTVPKDGGTYADRYPYLLAPGEEVISNRHGQADRWRPLLKAINAGRLADGGTVGLASRYDMPTSTRPAPMPASPVAAGASGPQEIRGTLHIPGLGDGYIRGVVQSETTSDRHFERAMAGRGY